MKTKTILELLTLSTSLYHLARKTELIDRFNEISAKGKEGLNQFATETIIDEEGNELEFIDKIIFKTAQARQELEEKIEELIGGRAPRVPPVQVGPQRAVDAKELLLMSRPAETATRAGPFRGG